MKRGKIRSLTKEYLTELVKNSISLSEILRALTLDTSSGNFRTLKRKLFDDQINYDHIKNGPGYSKQTSCFKKLTSLEEILTENSYFNPTHLKKKLIKTGILEQKCDKCKIGPEWNNEVLCLQLDHINGISSDNRLFNLRLLCPNCHSQTATYGARNKTKKDKSNKTHNIRKTKIIWPSNDELILMLNKSNYVQVALILGVSDNAIRKRLKTHIN